MIQDQTTKVIYVGNGQTTHFPFKFKYNDKAHIHVAIYDIDTQVQTELTKDFFVDSEKNEVIYPGYQSGQEPPEAQIPPVLQANQKLVVYRQTPLTQEIDFGSKYPLPFVENGTDKNTMISQEMKEALERSVKVDMGSEVKPDELLTDIKQNVADANQSAQNAQQSANEAQEYAQNANANAQSINIRTFPNVESMKQANNLKTGGLIKTQGFYQPNDGGGADYLITDNIGEDEADEASIITLQKRLYAYLIIQDVLNVKQMGAYGDGVHDDTNVLKNKIFLTGNPYIKGITAYFPDGDYLISETLETSTDFPRSIRMEKNARIFTNTEDLEYLVRLGRWGTTKWNGSIIGGILDANDKAKCCFGASSYNYFSYQDVSCRNFKLYGVHTNPNNIPSYWFRGNNMYFKNTTEWTGSTSIRCGNVDNFFTDIFSEGVHKGIYLRDKTMVTNMHHWLLPDSGIVTDSCLAEIDNTDNASLGFGTVFTRCYADTTQYAIRVINTQNTDSSHVDVWTRDCFFHLADTDSGAIYVLNNGARVTDIGSYFFTSKNANAKVVKADTPDYNSYTFVATTIAGNNNDNAFFDNWHRLKSQGIDNANNAIYEGTYFMLPSAQNAPKNVNTMLEVVRSPQSWNNNQAYILQKAYTLETDQTITLYVRYGLGFNNSITFKRWTRIASWQADA
jgi:hypothetical protein